MALNNDMPAQILFTSERFMAGKISEEQYVRAMRSYWNEGVFDGDDLAWLAQAVIEKDADT